MDSVFFTVTSGKTAGQKAHGSNFPQKAGMTFSYAQEKIFLPC